MRTRAVLGSIFASAAVLAVGWQAGANVLAATSTPQVSGTATSTTPSSTSSATSTSTGTATATPTPTATATEAPVVETPVVTGPADGTYTGSAYSTRWGDVQVSVTISGGAITDVAALQLTDADGKSVQISNRAAPILREEVIASQSAAVSTVGGATYTSEAYLSSVQSALDLAGF